MIDYKITKNGLDDYTLKYKDKEIRFHSKVGIVKELQNINKKARMKMVEDLAEQGKTIKDLVIEKVVGEKIIYDNSNKNFIEEGYINDMQGEVFTKALEEMLGIPFESLIKELEVKTEEESEKLATELGTCLIPSSEKNK